MHPFDKLYDFSEERECDYRDRHYTVRDNGTIMRHPKAGKKAQKLDNLWTFGNASDDGYMIWGGERVHRIVATAFHGEAPSSEHVADHIDTNRKNNRPENLRWLTRLENIIFNEITRRKLELLTGLPIKIILQNPSILKSYNMPKNIAWMSQVSKEEGEKSLESWMRWVNKKSSRQDNHDFDYDTEDTSIQNKPQHVYWIAHYACCPIPPQKRNIYEYFKNIKKGELFYDSDKFKNIIIDADINEMEYSILVKTYSPAEPKHWVLHKVICQHFTFEHHYRTFFSKDGLEKYYLLGLGKEWLGGDVIDDFC